jgi:hypothetical protein
MEFGKSLMTRANKPIHSRSTEDHSAIFSQVLKAGMDEVASLTLTGEREIRQWTGNST